MHIQVYAHIPVCAHLIRKVNEADQELSEINQFYKKERKKPSNHSDDKFITKYPLATSASEYTSLSDIIWLVSYQTISWHISEINRRAI